MNYDDDEEEDDEDDDNEDDVDTAVAIKCLKVDLEGTDTLLKRFVTRNYRFHNHVNNNNIVIVIIIIIIIIR